MYEASVLPLKVNDDQLWRLHFVSKWVISVPGWRRVNLICATQAVNFFPSRVIISAVVQSKPSSCGMYCLMVSVRAPSGM